jgi:hypothetical protein
LLMGKNIISKDVLDYVKHLWVDSYGMGYVWLKKVKGGPEQIAYYIAKYISKGMSTGKKHNRVYSMSRNLRKLFKMHEVKITIVEFGRIFYCADGSMQFQSIWRAVDHSFELPEKIPDWVTETIEFDCQMKLDFKWGRNV